MLTNHELMLYAVAMSSLYGHPNGSASSYYHPMGAFNSTAVEEDKKKRQKEYQTKTTNLRKRYDLENIYQRHFNAMIMAVTTLLNDSNDASKLNDIKGKNNLYFIYLRNYIIIRRLMLGNGPTPCHTLDQCDESPICEEAKKIFAELCNQFYNELSPDNSNKKELIITSQTLLITRINQCWDSQFSLPTQAETYLHRLNNTYKQARLSPYLGFQCVGIVIIGLALTFAVTTSLGMTVGNPIGMALLLVLAAIFLGFGCHLLRKGLNAEQGYLRHNDSVQLKHSLFRSVKMPLNGPSSEEAGMPDLNASHK